VPVTAGAGAAAAAAGARYALATTAGPQLYEDIDTVVSARLTTGIEEFDRVLGGGVVPGSLVLPKPYEPAVLGTLLVAAVRATTAAVPA